MDFSVKQNDSVFVGPKVDAFICAMVKHKAGKLLQGFLEHKYL